MAASLTPMEDAIRTKVTQALNPRTLEIHNDSHHHAHHQAMRGVTSKETHFRLLVVSDDFAGKGLRARHQLIYSLLKDEMAQDGGIHALQMTTRTLAEQEKHLERQQQQQTDS
ncbi:UV-induced protein [Drechslerella dactyloides]|uniref:UV-induced protein n=1 Tax=Drechslerella dactyloides TaxID=74499 RepID=A0AAD6IYR4_DREDA|nr:UV-induced protein [Drechslerella dactyloides]